MELVRIASLADIEEIEKVPLDQRLKAKNTYDVIKNGAAIDPEAMAISFFLAAEHYASPLEVKYRDLLANINRTANLFHDLGVGPGDVISFLLPNAPQTHYVLWGGEAAGVVSPINPMLEPATIRDICQAVRTKVLVALADLPGSEIWKKVEAIRRDLPDLKAVVRMFGPSDEKNGIYGYDEVIGRYNPDRLDSKREIDPGERASIYHTGGTTGTPKLAPHTHLNEAFMAHIGAMTSECLPGETLLGGLPLFHVNGTMVTGLVPFSIGARVLIVSPLGYRDPTLWPNFYKIVEHYRAVSFSAVPTILSVLLDVPIGQEDISSLRFALCGAAPLSQELFNRFEAYTGMKVREGYGLTEGTTVSSINPYHGVRKVGSIGLRVPYQEMKVFILDDDGVYQREAALGEIGNICIKGPNVFAGYLDERHNQGIWPLPGWFNTGDLGRLDADGYFWLTGRKKELIIRGGHNIDPMSVEEPLYRLPGVMMAAAVGLPDPHAGEVPAAYVQLQEGSVLTSGEILDYLKKEIGERAAVPREVVIIKQMPLTLVGKIFKPALRWDAIRRVYEQELQPLGDWASAVEVSVGEDKTHGALARILVKPTGQATPAEIEAKISELLARFTVRHRVEFV
ncbi:MAG: acyl-CoA synthetase [Pseudomonadota bacterium]